MDGWIVKFQDVPKPLINNFYFLLSVKDLQQVFRRNSAKISTQNKSKLNMETSSDFQIVFSKSDFLHVILPAKIRRINVQLAVSEYSLIFFFIRLFVILTGLHQINIKRCLITFSKCPSKVCTFSRSWKRALQCIHFEWKKRQENTDRQLSEKRRRNGGQKIIRDRRARN